MSKWSIEKIKNGMERFYKENSRYPSARDFDTCNYLPPARYIQRNLGGLSNFRSLVTPNEPTKFTTGRARSLVAKNNIKRSYELEHRFYNFLISKFPEVQVHEQKRLRPGNIASDFFIYLGSSTGFAIDIFYSSDRFNTIGIINIKAKRYSSLKIPIVFVVIGEFNQENIETLLKAKKNKLKQNMYLYTEKHFKENLKHILKQFAL